MSGRMIGGRYRLVERLGDGSLWRAEDTELEREVAVRLLAPDEAASPAVHLSHPGIVRVFDHGESDGDRFEVQEYVAGESLAQRLERGPLSEEERQRIAAGVTAAIAYAHEQGIAHGALGPESVLVDPDGHAKVTGFAVRGTEEDDQRALAALVPAAEPTVARPEPTTAILPPPAPLGRSRRRLAVLGTAAAVALAAAGVGAALLATSGGDGEPSAPVVPISTRAGEATEPEPPAPTTSAATTTTAPATTEPETTAPATTEPLPVPLPTTAPLPTTEPLPPTTTEEAPPPTDVTTATVVLP